ncbi:PRA1 family protein F2 [Forsythia ovata]|uniref:PRA1 family protein n=1 Tax=Forsythia ovata TaxID=205694 RepID=A0ABD1QP98_9LAMI
MASYGTTTQRPATSSPSPTISRDDESEESTRKYLNSFQFTCPFNIPSTPESAAVRIIKNLAKFSLYYAIFVWTVLFITLIPQRKVSLILLVAMTEVTVLYFLLLRALPNSVVLHRIIDKRVVLFLLFMITSVELILTHAFIHLFATLSATIPIILLHAVLTKRDEVFVNEEGRGAGELVPLVEERVSDAEPVNLV